MLKFYANAILRSRSREQLDRAYDSACQAKGLNDFDFEVVKFMYAEWRNSETFKYWDETEVKS